MIRPLSATLLALLGLALLPACRRDEIRTYTVKKEPAAPAAPVAAATTPAGLPADHPPIAGAAASAAPSMANTAVNTASGPGLVWTAPAHWTAGPERPMRKATLLISAPSGGPGAELTVTAFPGDVGGNLANVNRWRQQLALPPIADSELASALTHLDAGALHIDHLEIIGPGTPPEKRLLGAIVPFAGATWFFKLTGPDALVAAERPAFLAFLQTLRPAS